MKILASGCSFTAGGPKQSWPTLIDQKSYVTNLGRASAGNRYIGQSIINELSTKPGFYDIVLVMWSGLRRIDLNVSKITYDMLNGEHSTELNNHYYGFVGDAYTHAYGAGLLKLFGQEYFMLADEQADVIESLTQMVCLQSFLKSMNMPYRFMSYINYWNDWDQVTNINCGVYKYQSCRALTEQIDFSNFIFYNNQRDGIYEFAKENNLLDSDGFHPSLSGHQSWANLIKEKISEVK